MINFKENGALTFKYIYWGIIIFGLLFAGTVRLFSWSGFTEPIDIHWHPDKSALEDKGFDGEKWLQENQNNERNQSNDEPVENDPD